MKERGWIEPSWIAPIVERVVGQAVDGHAAQLTDEIVRRVMEEIAAEAPAADPGCGATSASGTREPPAVRPCPMPTNTVRQLYSRICSLPRWRGFVNNKGWVHASTSSASRTNSDRKSTRLNSSHLGISYAVFC